MTKNRLFTPGPTPVPERVLERGARPLIHHRTDEFESALSDVHKGLRYLYDTTQPVLVLAASGTGSMEAAFANTVAPGERVITVNGGKFGERWGRIARAYGIEVDEIMLQWGESVSSAQIIDRLKANEGVSAIFLTHSETSTGALTDIEGIIREVRPQFDGLFVVDGITAVGAHETRFDSWDIDVLVTGSQKGLMIPPGLACIALSERAWRRVERGGLPRFYFDLTAARKAYDQSSTPWTPAVSLVLALDEALQMIREEGREAVWQRHTRLAAGLRKGVEGLGLTLLPTYPSNALTAINLPEGCGSLPGHLSGRYGYTIAGGQDHLKGKIARISHLGYYDESDMIGMLYVLERGIADLTGAPVTGDGVSAATRYFGEADQ